MPIDNIDNNRESTCIRVIFSAMPRGGKKTGLIAVRLEAEIMTAIEAEADREDRPTAAMARILIKEALAARESKELPKKGKRLPQEG